MPASDISRLSISGLPKSDMAACIAKDIAHREVGYRIQSGALNRNDAASIEREYRNIYSQEYYKYYAHFLQQDQVSRIVYVPTENASAKKFFTRHTVVNFSRLNCFIHVHRDCITVGRINYPTDEDTSPETKEAFLSAWPGPLDRNVDLLKRNVTDYIDTLWQHDSQRRIRYCVGANDDHRKTILKLLTELLHRNGTIDAPGITRLLLQPEQTAIQKDEGNKKPLETLQKYLLLGKRIEAIKFAKSRKLWDHAQCLAFLDKYQPPNSANYIKDGVRLKDDFLVQLNDEYINSLEQGILSTVYHSLMNRLLQSDPESMNIIKLPNVSNPYDFAILSANDCEMEFDQSNEIFKLIVAIKQANLKPAIANNHLISLGYTTMDSYDPSDDLSFRSHISFKQGDTYASRTLTISNIDMLILNETWEYCLNLARGTCNPTNYEYLINLVPYKLVFASRLLDFGLHKMFAHYLSSIKNALAKANNQQFSERDPFYDWSAIERCVDHLSRIWDIFRMSPETLPQQTPSPESVPIQHNSIEYNPLQGYSPSHSLPNPMISNETNFYLGASQNDYPSLPYQDERSFPIVPTFPQVKQNTPPPRFNQLPIQEEVTDFNPETPSISAQNDDRNSYNQPQSYNDYSNGPSRRESASQSTDMPVFSPSFGLSSNSMYDQKVMTSSSPVNNNNNNRDSMPPNNIMEDSFKNPISPINQYDDLPRHESNQLSGRASMSVSNAPTSDPVASTSGFISSNSNNNGASKPQPSGDQQQPGFFGSLVGSAKALLPKSNSREMKLPDDSKTRGFQWSAEKNAWIDPNQPDEVDNVDPIEAPPKSASSNPPSYAFAAKTKTRNLYPKPQF